MSPSEVTGRVHMWVYSGVYTYSLVRTLMRHGSSRDGASCGAAVTSAGLPFGMQVDRNLLVAVRGRRPLPVALWRCPLSSDVALGALCL